CRVTCFAREVHRVLKPVEAENNPRRGYCGEYSREVGGVRFPVHADTEIFSVKPGCNQCEAIVVMITAPSTHAQTAPGPAIPAARQAPNSHPDPMIEPNPVSIRAMLPTSRRIGVGEFMRIC